ncbi:uncharacterized protein Z518_07854 [Rhinocladiella mackenziei CBS 650.93]|uniref:Protein CMS1 n=1 Tax=Rhinocladiella mackenziei CBS 650.93 TaxID=1442369 RepID=A0A0D2IZ69_9EURO|nr:uncharacterized protein Z518_07854 [Rhinocladiella mackenziei CBS 650.93]KIX01915.1 hypothetical protein Z518_07854 [Rhinocladiella mackenziei CBS 650.93]
MSKTKHGSGKSLSIKRKLNDAEVSDKSKSPKRPKHNKQPKSDVVARQRPAEVDESIALMDPLLLTDHFAKSLRRCFPDGGAIAIEDQYLPTKAILDSTNFDKAHVTTNLPEFLETFSQNGKSELSTCEEETKPHTLVITSSGIRTADLTRALRTFHTKECQVAKLIAKHMKLQDNVEYMKKTKVGIAISTPVRLQDLIEAGAIQLDGLRRIVVDGSYRDEKKRTIFEMDELFRPLMALLNLDGIRRRYAVEESIKIMVF